MIPSRYKLSIPSFSSSPATAAAPASSLAPVVLEWLQHIWLTQCHSTLLFYTCSEKSSHTLLPEPAEITGFQFLCVTCIRFAQTSRTPDVECYQLLLTQWKAPGIYHCFQRLQPSVLKKILMFLHLVFCRKTCFPI